MVSHFASNLQLHAIVSGPLLEKILRVLLWILTLFYHNALARALEHFVYE
jgi:hypothetical protein